MTRATTAAAKEIRQRRAERKAAMEAAGWQFHEELRLDGVLPLVEGRLFRVEGQRGWFKFREARTTPDGLAEVDCFGPYRHDGTLNKAQVGAGAFRCFGSHRVTKVARRVESQPERG